MKNLKKKIIFCSILMYFVIFTLMIPEKNAFAAQPPFAGEGAAFDAEGNFWMVSRDRAASGGTRYSTLGWTIKRCNAPVAGNESVRVKLESYGKSEAEAGYLYVYFVIQKDVIYNAIASAYPQWAKELYANGGMVYLDGVMTVSENGVKRGAMADDGTLSGEVYTDYAGIANARGWRDKEALKSHFGKSVYFPANPQMLETDDPPVEETENVETVTVSSTPGADGLSAVNTLCVSSDEFDVETAIPSGEAVALSGSFHKYYYTATYEHYYGTKAVPVTAEVTYTLVWNDGEPHSERVTVTRETTVAREYSYWKIKDIDLYYLKGVAVTGGALPDGGVGMESGYEPDVSVQRNVGGMTLPAQTVALDGGTIDGGAEKPGVPSGGIAALADEKVGEITVRNDGFSVDGEVFLSAASCAAQTASPVTLNGVRLLALQKDGVVIPQSVENGAYPTAATAEYAAYFSENTYFSEASAVNAVSVHTPVVCVGAVTDDTAFNQQITPTEKKSLILGRTFAVSVGTSGAHIAAKGYGTRDYGEYAKARQVRFPFPVVCGGQTIAAGQWVTLTSGAASFTLPASVPEGDYEISYRTVAVNAGAGVAAQQGANLDRENCAASDSVAVTVVGRLYGFAVTDIIDYPRWKSVFWNASRTVRTDISYYSGTSDCDGNVLRAKNSRFLVPLLKGSHPDDGSIHAPGLGYRVAFELKTVGGMTGEQDSILLYPTYYYADAEGKNLQRVKLYEKEDFSEIYLPVTLTAENRTVTAAGMQTWSGSYRLPSDALAVNADVDLAEYVQKKGGRIKPGDDVFLRGGYILVRFAIYTVKDGSLTLDYANSANAARGYCDMWKTEGYQIKRVDSDGTVFSLAEGTVFAFDQTRNLQSDYVGMGTH